MSDDWNGADFIALEFGKENYLKIQLKGRLSFDKIYLGKNTNICFCDRDSNNWYLYLHDELCEIIIRNHENTKSWKDKGEYNFPTIPENYKKILEKYKISRKSQ